MTSKEGMWALFGFDDYYPSGGLDDLADIGSYAEMHALMLSGEAGDMGNYQLALLPHMRDVECYRRCDGGLVLDDR